MQYDDYQTEIYTDASGTIEVSHLTPSQPANGGEQSA